MVLHSSVVQELPSSQSVSQVNVAACGCGVDVGVASGDGVPVGVGSGVGVEGPQARKSCISESWPSRPIQFNSIAPISEKLQVPLKSVSKISVCSSSMLLPDTLIVPSHDPDPVITVRT